MKVYILQQIWWDDFNIIGVFSSKLLAEEYEKKCPRSPHSGPYSYTIEEYEIDYRCNN